MFGPSTAASKYLLPATRNLQPVDEAYVSKETSPVDDKPVESELSPQHVDELNFGNEDKEEVAKKPQLPYKDVPDYATGLSELDEPSTSGKQRSNNPWF